MIKLSLPYRRATPHDALAMAELVNIAGEGMPLYQWKNMAGPGESAWDIGEQRAKRDSGGFSYRNATVRQNGDSVVSALIGYRLPKVPEPVNYDELPPMFVPLQELEDMVPGTWYVNVLATYPQYQGNGYASKLLSIAEQLANDAHCRDMSIIVSDANTAARCLYERAGYTELATSSMVKASWENPGTRWVLLTKRL